MTGWTCSARRLSALWCRIRDRPAHLARFTEHVAAYFERDKADRHIPYRVLIVEQLDALPFNLGALRNIGFTLGAAASAYTCFHDLDYLPIWADYTWCEAATPLVWYGAESRPVAPGRSPNRVGHTLDSFWGGAVLMPNAAFAAIDGYSNGYWGWGWRMWTSNGAAAPRGCRRGGDGAPIWRSTTTAAASAWIASCARSPG